MKNIDFESLGIRIKDIRTQKNITQDQLAEMIGSDRAVIARIENGNKGCSMDYFVCIANALEISADYLLLDSLEFPEKTPEEVEISQIISGCTSEETTILIRTINALREIIKGFTIK